MSKFVHARVELDEKQQIDLHRQFNCFFWVEIILIYFLKDEYKNVYCTFLNIFAKFPDNIICYVNTIIQTVFWCSTHIVNKFGDISWAASKIWNSDFLRYISRRSSIEKCKCMHTFFCILYRLDIYLKNFIKWFSIFFPFPLLKRYIFKLQQEDYISHFDSSVAMVC